MPISTAEPCRSYIGATLVGLPREESLPRARVARSAGDVGGRRTESGSARAMVYCDCTRRSERRCLAYVRRDLPVRHRVVAVAGRASRKTRPEAAPVHGDGPSSLGAACSPPPTGPHE